MTDDLDFSDNAPTFSNEEGEDINAGNIGGNYIRMPKVGESVILHVRRYYKTDKNLVLKRAGEEDIIFAPKMRDGKIHTHKFVVATMDGKELTIQPWAIIGKLARIIDRRKQETKNALWSFAGSTIMIKHIRNGMDPIVKKQKLETYEVALEKEDGKFYQLNTEDEWVEVTA